MRQRPFGPDPGNAGVGSSRKSIVGAYCGAPIPLIGRIPLEVCGFFILNDDY